MTTLCQRSLPRADRSRLAVECEGDGTVRDVNDDVPVGAAPEMRLDVLEEPEGPDAPESKARRSEQFLSEIVVLSDPHGSFAVQELSDVDLPVDRFAHGVNDPAEPAVGGPHCAGRTVDDGAAAAPHAFQRALRHRQSEFA